MRRFKPALHCIGLCLLLVFQCLSAQGQSKKAFTFHWAVKELAFLSGFGYGIDNNSLPEGNYSPIHLVGHIGYKSLFLADDSVAGKQDFLLFMEPSYNIVQLKSSSGTLLEWDAGVIPGIKYYYRLFPKLVLSLYIGSGPSWYSATTRRQAPGFIFANIAGLGLQTELSDNWTLVATFRIRHMSNADTRQPNHGINTNNHLIGLMYRF